MESSLYEKVGEMKDRTQLHVRYFKNTRLFGRSVGSYRRFKADRAYDRYSVLRQEVKYSELIEALGYEE